jgi:hypothetical protein
MTSRYFRSSFLDASICDSFRSTEPEGSDSLRERPIKTAGSSPAIFIGIPGGIRTPDARLRTAALYPAELPGPNCLNYVTSLRVFQM